MWDVILDALLDSLKVFAVAIIIYIIISFLEEKIAKVLGKKNRFSPLLGSLLGLIPQCGISVVGANLYVSHHITMGTLVALFLSCSDEALPILLSTGYKDHILSVLLIVGIKFVVGFISGYLIDLVLFKRKEEVEHHLHEDHCEHDFENQELIGCCHHHLGSKNPESKLYKHFLHPLLHSIKIFIYCLIINLIFGNFIYHIGEENIVSFLANFKYISPIISSLIGLIPNCASSVIIAQTFLTGSLSLGSCVAGLCMNAGLGLIFIFKRKKSLKENLMILFTMLLISIFVGYIICLITGF